MAQEIKIFAMNDCDWYAAESVEDALKAMAEVWSYKTTPEGITAMQQDFSADHPEELHDKELDLLNYRDEDEISVRTFREQLAQMIADGQKFPCFFASTEY